MLLGKLRGCSLLARSSGVVLRHAQRLGPSCVEGQRKLSTDPNVYERKPWPYKTKQFNFFHMVTDFTSARLNENAVIIVVDGPPGCGKTEMAKSIAQEFHLEHVVAPTESSIFTVNGFDIRDLNPLLDSPKQRAFDTEHLFHERDPSKCRLFYNTQLRFYKRKYKDYVLALRHLLNTGQGVVIENSVWSDATYVETLYKLGYLSRNAFRHYKEYRATSIHEIYKPQLVFHIDAPTPYILEQMRTNYPNIADAPGLNKKFVDTLRESYKNQYLPYMSTFSEVLSYDATDLPDLDLLMLDLEKMDLRHYSDEAPNRFAQWIKGKEEQWAFYRLRVSRPSVVDHWLKYKETPYLPDENMSAAELLNYEAVCNTIPNLRYPTEVLCDKDGNLKDTAEVRALLADTPFAPASTYGETLDLTDYESCQ